MLLEAVRASCRDLGLQGQRVLVAVSGGVDSTVLLEALAECASALDLDLAVGHVNHGLRGARADADEDRVRSHACRLGLPFASRRVDPRALRQTGPSRVRPTLQEAARRVRYRALQSLAEAAGAGCIATAHTLDDQAETVLLRLFRGAGPDGLGGIPERSPDGWRVRPLLWVGRAEIERFARARGLSWSEDPSNRDPTYARSRLRLALAGIAADLHPGWLRAIGNLAEAQRRDSEWIEGLVEQEAQALFRWEEGALCIAAEGWQQRPEGLARRLVRLALRRMGAGREVSRVHLLRMLAFLRCGQPPAEIELPIGLRLRREAGGFRLVSVPGRGEPEC